jgi:two-component system LytT family sensor kinase
MTFLPEDGERGVAPALALYSILGFWLFYAIWATLRAIAVGIDGQIEIVLRRVVVTIIGIVVTWIFYLALRRFDRKPLGIRIIAGFALAAPFALAMAGANYYMYNIYDPVAVLALGDGDISKYAGQHRFILFQFVEDGSNRYFFLSAWAALYLALSYASEALRTERRAARLERAAQQAELRSLRYQVNPHFLFNTLNSLSTLVMRNQPDEAERMIMSLSNFYRTSLTGDPLDDVPLEEEVHLQKLYLDIEGVRFPERLRTIIDIPPDLLDACVPGLILQPLVENAIKYGVSRTTKPVEIHITARADGDRMHICVTDNGDKAPTPADAGSGIGLANVRDRLAARFGDQGAIDYGPRDGGGFAVLLTLPIIRRGC